MKLQINTSGAWRNVVEFDIQWRAALLEALVPFALALNKTGRPAQWCILHDDGHREWLGNLTDAVKGNA